MFERGIPTYCYYTNISFFYRYVLWLEAIGLAHYVENFKNGRKSYRVCSDHFNDSSYFVKRSLLKTAIPTLAKIHTKDVNTGSNTQNNLNNNIKPEPENNIKVGSPSVDDKAIEANTFIVDEHTLRLEINRRDEIEETKAAQRKSKLERYLTSSQKLVGPKISQLITCQMLMKKLDKSKFLVEHKLFCLDLYYHNPKAYRFLRQFINLPPIASLRSLYLDVNSGFISPRCLQILKGMVAQINPKERCCIVGITSTKLKKHVYYDIKSDTVHGVYKGNFKQWKAPAKKVCTLVVKGLLSTWQMPVAFTTFHDGDAVVLRHWCDSIIRILIFNGLDVRAFVSNQGDTDYRVLSELRDISKENNSFTVTGKVIYNIFDVKLLVKSLRDSLMNFDMSIGLEGTASWKHIRAFYNTDVELRTHLASNLTDSHVDPSEKQGTSTKHVVELFSETVATAMKAFIRLKLLDEEAFVTMNFISRVSDLLTLFDLDASKKDSRNRRQFRGKEGREFLEKLYAYFKGVMRSSDGAIIEPIVGLMVTIQSTLDLWKDFSDNDYFNFKSQSLNLVAIETCFKEINVLNTKRKNKCNELTTIEYIRAFNKYFLNSFIKNAQRNSVKNFKSSLTKLNEYLEVKIREDQSPDLKPNTKAILIDNLEHKIVLPDKNIVRYLAGYLMRKALEIHDCVQFVEYMDPAKKDNIWIDCDYIENFTLKIPVEFVIFVVKLEHEFIKVFHEMMSREVGAKALNAMRNLVFMPCRCFPLFIIKKLFIRIRIYNTLIDINRQIKTKDHFQLNSIEI